MAPSSSSSSAATSVQVALRIRPPTNQDSTSIPPRFQRSVIHANSSTSVSIESPSIALAGAGAPSAVAASPTSGPKKQIFTFDQVHGPSTTQFELFEATAQPLVSRFIEGFNCTILAYGQTSSGKTHSMTGVDLDADPSDPNNGMGIIPRAVSTIFARARQVKEESGGAWTYGLKASFIEIYNEDLIDLLAMDDAVKREVQIREDKDGHIIWGGLREMNVKNAGEVMGLLKKGTAIRRTNETDMNAQSSRSHAIFSLTLTQKRYSGTGHPPRSSSPLPMGGRSPSRLARPGSMIAMPSSSNRISSPTFGRPSTPSNSFAAAMGRGGLRPSSALGHAHDRPSASAHNDDESGEWVTITSKFHFVDLAGSERLKRTAAAGERIKEGISINSGLLALGNVISALGDPARAKSGTASYVPYRDSKLTRLLQDSLGGNAHTQMIACVSPAEWNAPETINTLKYANRARNIKNRAVINEKEDGWDDIEWLQGTVTRLRKELKGIKEGNPITVTDTSTTPSEVNDGTTKRMLSQMSELQNTYENLREKYVERTEELTRLRRELGEKHRMSGTGAIGGGPAKYEEIVGPVIEEYEKTIATMEAELNLNKAALRHTNELVEEKEEELAAVLERHSATELYIEELRSRVSKLSEREASTEAYVRDLEEKIKAYDESSMTSSESLSDLKRELSRYKETEGQSSKYITELEQRLSRADESVLALQQNVEQLESECERRREEVKTLEARLESFKQDGENWRSDLEARELKLKELEEKMVEWERKRQEAGETRVRLGGLVKEVASARRSLEVDLASVPVIPPEAPATTTPSAESTQEKKEEPSEAASSSPRVSELQEQLISLQQTHTATLADLSSVTAKYRDALSEISDLAAQIQEAKLNSPSIAEVTVDSPTSEKPPDTPSIRRGMSSPRMREADLQQPNSAGRRLFFRQAASAESLHARSLSQSQSLSQELSSVHLRKASFSSHGSSSHSPSNSHSHSLSHSRSHSTLHSLRPSLSISMPGASPTSERSVASLEKEIMRLQEVLKEREAEISVLEESLKEVQQSKVVDPQVVNGNGASEAHEQGRTSPVAEDGPGDPEAALSPKTLNRFDNIRKTMQNGHVVTDNGSNFSEDETLERLNELMLSMAQKESQHRETVEELNSQLTQTRRQLDDLTTLSRDQTLNMSSEIAALQQHHAEDLEQLEEVRAHERQLEEALEEAKASHESQMETLRAEHEQLLTAKAEEAQKLLDSLKEEHSASLSTLRSELEASIANLETVRRDHEAAITKLQNEHTRELELKTQSLDLLREEHQRAVQKLQTEHATALRQQEETAAATLQTTEEEYYNALTKLRGDHAEAIKTIAAETNATIERLREEHKGELRMAEIAKEGTIAASESTQAVALKTLQDAHAAAIARKEAAFAEEVENLNAGFIRKSKALEDDHALQIDRLRLEHDSTTGKLKSDWRTEVEALKSTIASLTDDHKVALQKLQHDSDNAIRAVQENQAMVLQELERSHDQQFASLKGQHTAAIGQLMSKHDDDLQEALENHEEEMARLREHHASDLEEMEVKLARLEEDHSATLTELQAAHEKAISEQQSKLTSTIEGLRKELASQQELAVKERNALAQEFESYKAEAHSQAQSREELRLNHEKELSRRDNQIASMEQDMAAVADERDELRRQLNQLRSDLEKTRGEQSKLIQEASKRESLVIELERHRSVLADLQENLQQVKDEKDVLQVEKNRADALVRELQAQLARSASPPNVHSRSPDGRTLTFQRGTGLPSMKLPPPTPPPSIPPPPAPRHTATQLNGDSNLSTSSHGSSAFTSSGSSKESAPESPSTSLGHLSNGAVPQPDPKLLAKLDQQTKLIDEQEAMIKTLNKQLTHCETDLQAHMDLLANRESLLGESEKNLRKARMQATELSRERDMLNVTLDTLRAELADTKREVATVRRSIVEEKQSLEQRLDEERRAKERARAKLDAQMEELQKRKSKFICL